MIELGYDRREMLIVGGGTVCVIVLVVCQGLIVLLSLIFGIATSHPPLYLHLAAQLDHAVCWDLEKLHRAFGTPAHPREQPFAPQRHPGLVGRSEQFLPPEEEAGGYHVERPANAIERSKFTRNGDALHEDRKHLV